ncbi:MAG: class B sortase, partial [Lachnospiraceae bacterium]|nr:class B sortase [Lachnospiraceae bacterium]
MPNRTKVEKMISKFGGKLTTLLAGLLAAALIIYSGYVLYDTFYIQKNAGNSWELVELKAQVMEDIDDGTSPTAGSLAEINKDFRAWLTIYDTNIDYPVMQGKNDLYYSSHDIYQKSSLTGSIYLAAQSSSDFSDNYNIVYGHHMDHKILFGGLDSFKDQDYFSSHKSGMLIAGNVIYDLEMFAVITTDAYEEAVYTVGNRDLTSLIAFIK